MHNNQWREFDIPLGNPSGTDVQDRRRFDPVTAITSGVGLAGNLVGGLFGKSAAKKAAEQQQAAAAAAAQKVKDAVAAQNPEILRAATDAGGSVVRTAADAAGGVSNAADRANLLLNPYSTAGTTAADALNTGIAPGGDFNKTPTLADLTIDPGYAFRTAESEKAIQSRAAALGGATGGGVLKALTKYRGAEASQEYQNAFQRFQTSTQNRFNNLNTVSRSGQEAAGAEGANLTGAAKYGGDITTNASRFAGQADIDARDLAAQNEIGAAKTEGEYLTQGGNARAAGTVGGTNALVSGITGGISSATAPFILKNLLKDPALSGTVGPPPEGVLPGGALATLNNAKVINRFKRAA